MAETSSLYKSLAAVGMRIERIGKDGTNAHFKYKYTSAEELYRAIRQIFFEEGLFLIPQATGYDMSGDLCTVRLSMTIVHVKTGESIEAQWYGQGQDKGDKAVFKAYTGGMKTWLKHLFLLPADDDPEADPSTDRAPARSNKPVRSSASQGSAGGDLTRLGQLVNGSGLTNEQKEALRKWVKPNGKARADRMTQALQLLEAGKAKELVELAS